MSHEVETMFSGSTITPWHKLGKVVAGQPTSADALELAGLNWRVRTEPLQIVNPEWRNSGEAGEIAHRAIVRDSDARVLGVVGGAYEALQNSDAFSLADDLFAHGARWESAGSLLDGSRVWMLCRMRPDDGGEIIAAGDTVKPYLLITTSHDGSAAVRVALTSIRVVCMNTLRMALGASRRADDALSIRHTRNVRDRVAAAARIVATAEDVRKKWADAARKMAETRIDRDAAKMLAFSALDVNPTELTGRNGAKKAEIEYRLRSEINRPGTVWGAVQAVTEFTSHSARAGRSRGMERLMQAADGSGDRANQAAWNSALALV